MVQQSEPSFWHLKFHFLLKIIYLNMTLWVIIDSEKKYKILLQYKLVPVEPESLDLFINSSPISN